MDANPALVLLKYQCSFWTATPKVTMTYGTTIYQEGFEEKEKEEDLSWSLLSLLL